MDISNLKSGLTFSDVLLVPKKTPLNSRREGSLNTRFTKNISLNIPLVSSNMASVTEHKMAIAMAREGGLGIIHQFCTIEEQVFEVMQVKKSTSTIIEDPVTVNNNMSLSDAKDFMNSKNVTSL